jgi:cytosine/adenosine deaminase-related metal-dependent hydrolase
MLLRARIVLPISRPPIEDGAVLISEGRIAALGRWGDLVSKAPAGSHTTDLGEVVFLPGLVNAHCHLDYTSMAGMPPPQQFSDWIKGLLALKAAASYTEYADSWLRGAGMLLRTGTTTVGDIEAVPELLPEVWSATPLRVVSFLEMTGVKSGKTPETILKEATDKMAALQSSGGWVGLSPHALYSTSPALLRATAQKAAQSQCQVTMHVAESNEEFEMFRHRRGPLFEWLKNQRDMSDCGQVSPVELVRRSGLLGERFLAVHANCLEGVDIEILAQSGSSVVHCPRSHAYFRHPPFRYQDIKAAGVNVCLGTDSLASVKHAQGVALELNMFTEMQTFARTYPGVPPAEILRMATIHSARALGLSGQIGEISHASHADFMTIPFPGKLEEAEAAVIHYCSPLTGVMIAGQWQNEKPGKK